MADSISSQLDMENYTLAELFLEAYCNTVNSIRFDFTKKSFRIVLPKIKNLNVGSITNK